MMNANFNLYPYRSEDKKRKLTHFGMVLSVFAGFAIVVIVFIHWALASQLSFQEARNQKLEDGIKVLDTKIVELKKIQAELEVAKNRKASLDTLHEQRISAVKILSGLIKVQPKEVYLKSLKQTKEVISISGFATNNASISNFMTVIAASEIFSNPQLVEIKSSKTPLGNAQEFSMTFIVPSIKSDKDAATVSKKRGAK